MKEPTSRNFSNEKLLWWDTPDLQINIYHRGRRDVCRARGERLASGHTALPQDLTQHPICILQGIDSLHHCHSADCAHDDAIWGREGDCHGSFWPFGPISLAMTDLRVVPIFGNPCFNSYFMD